MVANGQYMRRGEIRDVICPPNANNEAGGLDKGFLLFAMSLILFITTLSDYNCATTTDYGCHLYNQYRFSVLEHLADQNKR